MSLATALTRTGGSALLDLFISAASNPVVDLVAPEVVAVLGATLAAEGLYYLWTQQQTDAVIEAATKIYCGKNSDDLQCAIQYEFVGINANVDCQPRAYYKFSAPYGYKFVRTPIMQDYRHITQCGFDFYEDVQTLNPDGSIREAGFTSVGPAIVRKAEGYRWQDWDAAKRQKAIQDIPKDTWKDIVATIPEAGKLANGQTIPSGAILVGNPDSLNLSERQPRVISQPTIVKPLPIISSIPAGQPVTIPTTTDENIPFVATPSTVATPTGEDAFGHSITIPIGIDSTITFNPDGTVTLDTPGSPSIPTTAAAPTDLGLPDIWKELQHIRAALPLVAPAVAISLSPSLIRNLDAPQVRAAARAGTCDTTQEGGCLARPLRDIQNNQNSLLQGIDQLTQAGQGAALAAIEQTVTLLNTKIGDVAGIGSVGKFLNGLGDWAGISRIMEVITLVGVIHNALMLSNNVEQTLFQIINSVIYLPELVINPKAEMPDSQKFITTYLDNYFKNALGKATWEEVKIAWKELNTINSTAGNILNNFQQIIGDTQNIQNVTSGWVAELGNALKAEGIIGDDNWDDKPEKPQFRSGLFKKLEGMAEGIQAVDNALQSINQVTQALVDIVQQGHQIAENGDKLSKEVNAEIERSKKLVSDAIDALPEIPLEIEDLY